MMRAAVAAAFCFSESENRATTVLAAARLRRFPRGEAGSTGYSSFAFSSSAD